MNKICNNEVVKMEVYCDQAFMTLVKSKLLFYTPPKSINEKRNELLAKRTARKNP
jgi:hypothetical protein